MGNLLSARGRGPTKIKVEAVQQARKPESISEIRSFQGPVTYCARFIPDLSTISEPLRKLLSKEKKLYGSQSKKNQFKN